MIEILKFKGTNTNKPAVNCYVSTVLVSKAGEERTMYLPAHARTASGAASMARKWRKVEGNMERLEASFDAGEDTVKAVPIKLYPRE